MAYNKNVTIPAVRLSDGTLFQGEPHTILALRAIEYGLPTRMVAGYLDLRGNFKPINRPASDFFAGCGSPAEARKLASRNGMEYKEAAIRFLGSGEVDDEILQALIDEYDRFSRVPLAPAVKHIQTGDIWIGRNHGDIISRNPQLDDNPQRGVDGDEYILIGFRHDNGSFLTRSQACDFITHETGYSTNGRKMLAGEEYITRIETEADAIGLGRSFHFRGFAHARLRHDNYRSRGINKDYRQLLQIAMKEYQNGNERGQKGIRR